MLMPVWQTEILQPITEMVQRLRLLLPLILQITAGQTLLGVANLKYTPTLKRIVHYSGDQQRLAMLVNRVPVGSFTIRL